MKNITNLLSAELTERVVKVIFKIMFTEIMAKCSKHHSSR